MSRYLPKNTKTGDFKQQRTLSGSFFVIPERLASIRAVVLAFTANKQTNTQSIYRRRRMMAKLRGGTAELGIEIGRWHGLIREDRVYKECGSGEVEDTEHFVMRCAYVVKERKRLENLMSSRVKGWHELAENEKVLRIMDRACCDEAVARAVESLWKKRFVADVPIPHQT